MVSNVLIASMNKGQFPPACVFILLLVMILKMPPADVSILMNEILQHLKNGYYLGYAWGVITTFLWYRHLRWQRRTTNDEVKRISEERNMFQAKQLGGKNVTSSEEL